MSIDFNEYGDDSIVTLEDDPEEYSSEEDEEFDESKSPNSAGGLDGEYSCFDYCASSSGRSRTRTRTRSTSIDVDADVSIGLDYMMELKKHNAYVKECDVAIEKLLSAASPNKLSSKHLSFIASSPSSTINKAIAPKEVVPNKASNGRGIVIKNRSSSMIETSSLYSSSPTGNHSPTGSIASVHSALSSTPPSSRCVVSTSYKKSARSVSSDYGTDLFSKSLPTAVPSPKRVFPAPASREPLFVSRGKPPLTVITNTTPKDKVEEPTPVDPVEDDLVTSNDTNDPVLS
jgi:hypothetical protein